MDHSTQHSRTPDETVSLPPMDADFGQQIADLRREIEGIQELNMITGLRSLTGIRTKPPTKRERSDWKRSCGNWPCSATSEDTPGVPGFLRKAPTFGL